MRLSGRDFVIKNGKKISLLILLCGFSFTFFTLSGKITGMAAGDSQIVQNIERSQESVNFVVQEREVCYNDLNSARTSYNECQTELVKEGEKLSNCTAAKETAEKSYSECQTAKNTIENQLTGKIADYDELAKNSVTSICCSFSDFKSGTIKSWSISENNILCTGSYTVNCTNGEVTK